MLLSRGRNLYRRFRAAVSVYKLAAADRPVCDGALMTAISRVDSLPAADDAWILPGFWNVKYWWNF